MGLGMTSRVVEVWDEGGTRMAHVDTAGETRRVCLSYMPDLGVGDYAVVHAGFALTRLDEQAALTAFDVAREPTGSATGAADDTRSTS